MRKNHEALLIAALAGIVIAGAGAFAIQPVASGHMQKYAVSPTSAAVLNQLQGSIAPVGARPSQLPVEG